LDVEKLKLILDDYKLSEGTVELERCDYALKSLQCVQRKYLLMTDVISYVQNLHTTVPELDSIRNNNPKGRNKYATYILK